MVADKALWCSVEEEGEEEEDDDERNTKEGRNEGF